MLTVAGGPDMQVSIQIRAYISGLAEGKLFTTRELLNYGSRAAVDQALHRLVAKGQIVRMARGVFVKESEGRFRPAVSEVALAKARSFGKDFYGQIGGSCSRCKSTPQLESPELQSEPLAFICSGAPSSFDCGGQRVFFISCSRQSTGCKS